MTSAIVSISWNPFISTLGVFLTERLTKPVKEFETEREMFSAVSSPLL